MAKSEALSGVFQKCYLRFASGLLGLITAEVLPQLGNRLPPAQRKKRKRKTVNLKGERDEEKETVVSPSKL